MSRESETMEPGAGATTNAHAIADGSLHKMAPRAQGARGTAMDLVHPSQTSKVVARLLLAFFGLGAALLWVTPWQQSAPGSGKVVAYTPEERRQNVEAPVEGRILRWYVRDGSVVKAGDPLVDLTDNDPEILGRLRAERDALVARLEAAKARVSAVGARVDALGESRRVALMAAESRSLMAQQRVSAAEQALSLAGATLRTAELNIERQRSLSEEGLTSRRQLELTELDFTRATTEVERARLALTAAKAEAQAITSDRDKVGNDGNASIKDAQAGQASAEAEIASATAEIARIDVRLARQSAQSVTAPRDGTILRIVANGRSGEIVKSGDILAVLIPDTADRAVELWVSGNDVPLLRVGSRARVQFEGWPALQFSGWPSVAVGTFGGRVAVIDASDNGQGAFRVLIVPDEGQVWPAPLYLRQGVRAQGWVQLGRVRLGYELWRQFNGFPPSLDKEPGSEKGDKDKGGKDAKGGSK